MSEACGSGRAMRRRLCGSHAVAGPSPHLHARRPIPAIPGRHDEEWPEAAWGRGPAEDFFDFEPTLVLPDHRWSRRRDAGLHRRRRRLASAIVAVFLIAVAAIPLHAPRDESPSGTAASVVAGPH